MEPSSLRPQRSSIRLAGFDYSQPGAYFITLVTFQRIPLFGHFSLNGLVLSQVGDLATRIWLGMEMRFPDILLDEFIIMPDHMHGIIIIGEWTVGARQNETSQFEVFPKASPADQFTRYHTLGEVVGGFKSTLTRIHNRIKGTPGQKIWQRNYYERIIRNERELDQVRLYIQENPYQGDDEITHVYPWDK